MPNPEPEAYYSWDEWGSCVHCSTPIDGRCFVVPLYGAEYLVCEECGHRAIAKVLQLGED